MNDEELIDLNQHLNEELTRVRGLLQRQWISVEERLPELNQNILVCNVGGGVWSSIYGKFGVNEEETGFYEQVWCPGRCEEYREVEERNITHWQPLPDPPNFRESSSLVPQGAESADIGKLDTADKSGCGYCGKPADDLIHTCRAAHDYVDHDCHPYRDSSLSSKEKK